MSLSFAQRAVTVVLAVVAVWYVTPARADEADDQYAVAAGHYAQQRWQLAAETFQALLTAHPGFAKGDLAAFYYGESLLQLHRHDEAAVWYREYLRRSPTGPQARQSLFRLAESAYLSGRNEPAKRELQRFLQQYPDDGLNAFVLAYLGDVALVQADSLAAERYFRQCLKRFPEGRMQDDCRLGLARAQEKQGNTDDAERLYLALAAKTSSPVAADAQFYLGALQYARGNYPEAVKSFDVFESTWPADVRLPTARLDRGWALFKLKRFGEARAAFSLAATNRAVGPLARYWLGLTEKEQGQWAEAAATFLALADTDPKFEQLAALRFHAGDALMHAGDRDGARRQFDRVAAADGNDGSWSAYAALGKIQLAQREKDYAAVDAQDGAFAKRFSASPLRPEVERLRGRSLLDRQQYTIAIGVFEPLVALAGNNDAALEDRYLLALAYEGARRYKDGLAVLAPVLAAAHASLKSDALLTQGSLLVAVARYRDATATLLEFLQASPRGDAAVRARAYLSLCHARCGRLDEAKRLYAEIQKENPRPELIQAITDQLSEAALDAGDPTWAATLFGRLAKADTSREEKLKGLSGQAWSEFKAGHPAEAEHLFAQLLQEHPADAMASEAALARGQILEQLGRADPALAMYDMVIQRYTKTEQYPQALLAAAREHHKLQQYSQAVDCYERLAKEFPKLPQIDAVLYEWAWALVDAGKSEASKPVMEQLYRQQRKSPFWPDVTYRLAQQSMEARDYGAADSLLAELLRGKADAKIREHALYLRGQVAAAMRQWPLTQKAYQSLLDEFPKSSMRLSAEYWIAEACYRQGDYDGAGQRLERLAGEFPAPPEPWMAMVSLRRAQVMAQAKRWQDAYAIASKIETDFPGFQQQYEVYYVVGRCLAAEADFEGARQAYQKAIHAPGGAKTETAAMSQWMIGESYFHQKNYEAALRAYLQVEILYAYPTWQSGALLQAGKCRELLGEWKEAVQLYEQLLSVYPHTTFTHEAQQRLKAARLRIPSDK